MEKYHKFISWTPVVTTSVFLTQFGLSQTLLDENFNSNDGSFIEEATGATPIPAVYNAAAGSWEIEGDDAGPATNYLTSPEISASKTGGLEITFSHRYSIEPDQWDGAAVEFSVNGEPFEQVPPSAFSEGGYDSGILRGNHVLNGSEAFAGDSEGYLNGDFVTSTANVGGVESGATFEIRFVGAWDEAARGPSLPNWEITSVAVEYLPDSDNDGMPDDYETDNDLDPDVDDAADDSDSDGASNLDEFLAGTAANDDDSDDDGVLDGAELSNGTDPLNVDTDGDGLEDGVETNTGTLVDANDTGTDPLSTDTDEDGIADNIEVREGSDPNDPNSVPDIPVVSIIGGLLGGDLTDPEDDGIDIEGAGFDPAANNWNFISINANDEPDFQGGEFSFNIFDNQVGGGNAKWCCNPPNPELTVTVEFEEEYSLTHFTITSGNDTPTRDPLTFFIEGSNDGVTFEEIYQRDDDTPIWTPEQRNTTAQINLPSPADPYRFFRYRATRTGGPNHQINEIELFGEVGMTGPLLITDFSYDPETAQVTLTWNSREDREYSLFASTDLLVFDQEISDGVASQGDQTTFSFQNFTPDAETLFFRVEENE